VVDAAEYLAERRIQAAIERGEFDDLPGAGKPLDLSDADDPDWWLKRFLRREQVDTTALLPSVFVLRREYAALADTVADLPTEAAVRRVVADYNRRVKEDRLSALSGLPRPPVLAPLADEDEIVATWRQRNSAT
jgi:hypothetical protein